MTAGSAQISVTGGATATLSLTLRTPAVYAPPPGGLSLTFADGAGNVFGIGGVTFTGARRTSSSLVVSLYLPGRGFFASSQAECRIVIPAAAPDAVDGTFTCRDLTGAASPTSFTGSFAASA